MTISPDWTPAERRRLLNALLVGIVYAFNRMDMATGYELSDVAIRINSESSSFLENNRKTILKTLNKIGGTRYA